MKGEDETNFGWRDGNDQVEEVREDTNMSLECPTVDVIHGSDEESDEEEIEVNRRNRKIRSSG